MPGMYYLCMYWLFWSLPRGCLIREYTMYSKLIQIVLFVHYPTLFCVLSSSWTNCWILQFWNILKPLWFASNFTMLQFVWCCTKFLALFMFPALRTWNIVNLLSVCKAGERKCRQNRNPIKKHIPEQHYVPFCLLSHRNVCQPNNFSDLSTITRNGDENHICFGVGLCSS